MCPSPRGQAGQGRSLWSWSPSHLGQSWSGKATGMLPSGYKGNITEEGTGLPGETVAFSSQSQVIGGQLEGVLDLRV